MLSWDRPLANGSSLKRFLVSARCGTDNSQADAMPATVQVLLPPTSYECSVGGLRAHTSYRSAITAAQQHRLSVVGFHCKPRMNWESELKQSPLQVPWLIRRFLPYWNVLHRSGSASNCDGQMVTCHCTRDTAMLSKKKMTMAHSLR
jgi:hypothetical protein